MKKACSLIPLNHVKPLQAPVLCMGIRADTAIAPFQEPACAVLLPSLPIGAKSGRNCGMLHILTASSQSSTSTSPAGNCTTPATSNAASPDFVPTTSEKFSDCATSIPDSAILPPSVVVSVLGPVML